MIKEVAGDILLTKAQAIAHGIAPNDHFNSGLALSLREQWPAMYQDFRHFCHANHPKPGEAWIWGGADGKRIVSLFTQEPPSNHHGNPGRANTHNVNLALRELRHVIEKENFASVALPRLATGVGGLDWEEVKPLISKHLGDLTIPVYVYTTYAKGKSAEE
ncbi:MAG: macro domain-containing protein [Acidobacteriota bacterium]|nr:macro domain-containing protein [Acidobacteriota bacterium]